MSAILEDLFAERPAGYDRLIDGPYSQSALMREMDCVRAEIAKVDRKYRKSKEQLAYRDRCWDRYGKLFARYVRGH